MSAAGKFRSRLRLPVIRRRCMQHSRLNSSGTSPSASNVGRGFCPVGRADAGQGERLVSRQSTEAQVTADLGTRHGSAELAWSLACLCVGLTVLALLALACQPKLSAPSLRSIPRRQFELQARAGRANAFVHTRSTDTRADARLHGLDTHGSQGWVLVEEFLLLGRVKTVLGELALSHKRRCRSHLTWTTVPSGR